jgi:hypothetical protein
MLGSHASLFGRDYIGKRVASFCVVPVHFIGKWIIIEFNHVCIFIEMEAECGMKTTDMTVSQAECGMKTTDMTVSQAERGMKTTDMTVSQAECGMKTTDITVSHYKIVSSTPRHARQFDTQL